MKFTEYARVLKFPNDTKEIQSLLSLEKLFDSGWEDFDAANEMPFICAYNNKLYVVANYSGMWEFDGENWKQLFPLGYEHIESFARTIFKEKLYFGFHEFDSGEDKGFMYGLMEIHLRKYLRNSAFPVS